jgi:hypothetical protein
MEITGHDVTFHFIEKLYKQQNVNEILERITNLLLSITEVGIITGFARLTGSFGFLRHQVQPSVTDNNR